MERELSKKEVIAASIIDSITDLLIVIDPGNYKIVVANKAFLDREGFSSKDIIGKTCHEVTHKLPNPCCPPHEKCPMHETVRTGKVVKEEHFHFDKNNVKYYVEVITSLLFDKENDSSYVLHVSRDISERKRAEEAI